MDDIAPEILDCLSAFLAASSDPAGGAALLASLAPDALVPWDGGLVRADAVPPEAYAAVRERDAAGRPVFSDAMGVEWRSDGTDGLLWGRVREVVDCRMFPIAAGLRRVDGAWRVAWVAPAPAPWTWDPALARASALAEAAAGAPAVAETWLERGYRRRYGHETPPLVFAPDARFACQGSGSCCSNALSIGVPRTAQAVIDAMPWELLAPELAGTRLAERPDGQLELKAAHEVCRFLDEERRCMIHLALGRPVFAACTVFPFAFARTPDGVVATVTTSCGSARAGLGPPLASRRDDIYERLYLAPRVDATDTYRLTADREVDWPTFRAAEDAVLAALRAPGPLHERLAAAAYVLEGEQPVPLAPNAATRGALAGLLAAITAGLTSEEAVARAPRHADLAEPEVLAGVLANMIFAKRASFAYDLLTAVNLAALLYFIALAAQAPTPGEPLPARTWELLGALPTHGPGFVALPNEEAGAPITGASLRQPGYVAWLLGFAA